MVDEVLQLGHEVPRRAGDYAEEIAIYQLELALKLLSCVLRVSCHVFSSCLCGK